MLSDFRQHFFLPVTEQSTYTHKFGICHLGIIPVRAAPASKSEQVTQLLFGETFQVTKVSADHKFVWIIADYDEYSGWVDISRWQEVSEAFYQKAKQAQHLMVDQAFALLTKSVYTNTLSFGSTLPTYTKGELYWEETMCYNAKIRDTRNKVDKHQIIWIAFIFLGTPYLWGGKSIFGIDCSGLTQLVYKAGGYFLPRDAYQQAAFGAKVARLTEAKTGDLVFFARKDNIIHVGIVLIISDIYKTFPAIAQKMEETVTILEGQKLEVNPATKQPYQWVLHAYDCVRIDILDSKGIYNANEKQYTHYTHSIKQIIP
ncbi:C40 family peptidase [Microscilla marina]|uniref:NLP/P60 n=1 Tax=Microscilla marina ATCC 23134 TaxID=313606 RepID=A1ZL65_MICM2|nr:C40 family peptidase [Microscilla marina]EAY29031.1 NLP/P60 [Microscilla marina ATCC 23134]